jgi:hypothetical protein
MHLTSETPWMLLWFGFVFFYAREYIRSSKANKKSSNQELDNLIRGGIFPISPFASFHLLLYRASTLLFLLMFNMDFSWQASFEFYTLWNLLPVIPYFVLGLSLSIAYEWRDIDNMLNSKFWRKLGFIHLWIEEAIFPTALV